MPLMIASTQLLLLLSPIIPFVILLLISPFIIGTLCACLRPENDSPSDLIESGGGAESRPFARAQTGATGGDDGAENGKQKFDSAPTQAGKSKHSNIVTRLHFWKSKTNESGQKRNKKAIAMPATAAVMGSTKAAALNDPYANVAKKVAKESVVLVDNQAYLDTLRDYSNNNNNNNSATASVDQSSSSTLILATKTPLIPTNLGFMLNSSLQPMSTCTFLPSSSKSSQAQPHQQQASSTTPSTSPDGTFQNSINKILCQPPQQLPGCPMNPTDSSNKSFTDFSKTKVSKCDSSMIFEISDLRANPRSDQPNSRIAASSTFAQPKNINNKNQSKIFQHPTKYRSKS